MVPCPVRPWGSTVWGTGRENDGSDMAARQLYRLHPLTQACILTIRFTSIGYALVALISSLVFRAIQDALPDNLEAQERILGANMIALAFGDVSTMYLHVEFSLD